MGTIAPTRKSIRLAGALAVALAGVVVSLGQAQYRWSAHNSLTSAIECHRRGDYEQAAVFFQQAQAGLMELTPVERQDLANVLQKNNEALRARQDGSARLAQAEDAFRSGRLTEANLCLREVTGNQFVTPGDRQRALQLSEILRSGGAGYAEGAGPGTRVGENTSQKVADDGKGQPPAKQDCKGLLMAGRVALARGDLDNAERLAQEAEKARSFINLRLWGDSPSKLLRDVQVARAKNTTPALPPSGGPNGNTEQARLLVQQGRQALRANDLAQARRLADQANGLKPDLAWNEDNPDKLLADIDRIEKGPIQAATARTGPPRQDAQAAATPVDAHTLLKQGRGLYSAGKLDEARERALLAQGAPDARWGYFEDTPDKLLKDIQKERQRRDQEESERLLAEARKQFEQGDVDGARTKAYRAERLHGPYQFWNLGDKPQKLLSDIDAAEAKKLKVVLPPPPPPPVVPPGPSGPAAGR
jgi:hypothetical protein